MNKVILSIFATCLLTVSCKSPEDSIDSLRSNFTSNAKTIEEKKEKFAQKYKDRMSSFQSGEFDLRKVNLSYIKAEMKNCRSEEDMIKIWEKGGVKNARKYLESIKEMHEAGTELHLSNDKKNEDIKSVIKKETVDHYSKTKKR